jgi:hypothetical protein
MNAAAAQPTPSDTALYKTDYQGSPFEQLNGSPAQRML